MIKKIKFVYLTNGTVVDFRREGISPELTGECIGSQLIYGITPDCYTAPGGVLTPKTTAAAGLITDQREKDTAYATVSKAIEDKKRDENLKNFFYNSVEYKSDKDSIQATQNQALSGLPGDHILTMRGTPYEGRWAAIGSYPKFTNAEFILFATEFFKIGSDNFTNRSMHFVNLGVIYTNPIKTAQDILNYDYSGGWK